MFDRFIATCCNPAPDGTRMQGAKTLVGVLARNAPLPPKAVDAVIALLAADHRVTDEDDIAFQWRYQLELPMRHESFVMHVLHAWNEVRCAPRWDIDAVDSIVSRMWTEATRHARTALAETVIQENALLAEIEMLRKRLAAIALMAEVAE